MSRRNLVVGCVKVLQQPAFVLHTRAFRETSLIVELFTPQFGRLAAVARGVRGRKKSGNPLQPFQPLSIAWFGRGPLFTLGDVEVEASQVALAGQQLACGFYMNELLVRMLEPQDPHEDLFQRYADALSGIRTGTPMSIVLRRFEFELLEACGYLPDLTTAASEPVLAGNDYRLAADAGLVACDAEDDSFSGTVLLAIANHDYALRGTRREALRLFRQLLEPHLGGKPLASRALLQGGAAS